MSIVNGYDEGGRQEKKEDICRLYAGQLWATRKSVREKTRVQILLGDRVETRADADGKSSMDQFVSKRKGHKRLL
jgi:hypothetical protein